MAKMGVIRGKKFKNSIMKYSIPEKRQLLCIERFWDEMVINDTQED